MFLLSPKEKIKRSQAMERDGNWRASRPILGPFQTTSTLPRMTAQLAKSRAQAKAYRAISVKV